MPYLAVFLKGTVDLGCSSSLEGNILISSDTKELLGIRPHLTNGARYCLSSRVPWRHTSAMLCSVVLSRVQSCG
jgi:hypothetical protein